MFLYLISYLPSSDQCYFFLKNISSAFLHVERRKNTRHDINIIDILKCSKYLPQIYERLKISGSWSFTVHVSPRSAGRREYASSTRVIN